MERWMSFTNLSVGGEKSQWFQVQDFEYEGKAENATRHS